MDVDPTDVSPTDVGPTDVGPGDVGPSDAGPSDTGPSDTGPSDVAPGDVGRGDVGPSDAEPSDAGPSDAGPSDAGPSDAEPSDAEPSDAGRTGAGPTGVAPTHAAPAGVVAAPWQALRRFTAARIALGRAGVAVPTAAELEFRLAHARARDAVHLPFDADAVAAALRAEGHETLTLASAAADRHVYLQRPDLGRRLDDASRERLAAWRRAYGKAPAFDLALVVADGLSALAVHRHAVPLVAALRGHLPDCTLAPVVLVHQGRVAIGDEVGAALGAACVVVLIGERPGLSSPDSLGLYISWAPRVGLTDAARNCISNVRPEGLAVEAAAAKLAWLLGEARRRRLTGVALKDEVDEARPRLGAQTQENFLVDAALVPAGAGTPEAGPAVAPGHPGDAGAEGGATRDGSLRDDAGDAGAPGDARVADVAAEARVSGAASATSGAAATGPATGPEGQRSAGGADGADPAPPAPP